MRIHHNNKSILKRIAAVCTACCLFTEAIGTVHEHKNKAFAENTPEAKNTFMVDQKRTLAYAGGRSYTMTLDAASYFSNEYYPTSTSQSSDNYYEAPYNGKYLVQLWGGDGGDGNQFESVSGKGGAGGYVWSIVTLNKGDVLLFNIGTKGDSTRREDTGGGQNGDGGAHGDDGSLKIGGGGGYSAVYYYPNGTFDGSLRPSEADRMSRYIMIAGGGGGGGGFELDSLFFRTNLPDGGSGGNINTSASGVISDSAVPGTYFAGSDGKSSGTSLAYVGKGGTYKPGAAVNSNSTYVLFVGNVKSSSESGNDWFRISLPDADGGSGGAGNLNGGAGGAGYCGGSGGTMKALLDNDNTGGGGGGSSFLASASNMTNILSDLTESEREIYEKSISDNSNSAQGGYCNIAYLSSKQPNLSVSVYENAAFTIPVSEYFYLTAVETHRNGTWTEGSNTITGVNISPDEHGRAYKHADITLTFTAKNDFPGGNNVPLLNGKIGMSVEGADLPSFDADDDLDKVNVPLAYTLDTSSFWHDKYTDADAPVTANELYSMNCTADSTDAYGNVISAVTMYPALTAPYNKPQATQTFDISYTVTPNEENKAKIGPVQHERTYSGTAVVNIKEEDTTYVPDSEHFATDDLDGSNSDITIKTSRNLKYENGEYQTVITVNAASKEVAYNMIENYHLATSPLTMSGNNITIPEDGWYLLEAWGGDGGDGQDADGANDAYGGAGGNGGYVYGFKEFQKGNVLECTIGASGAVSGNNTAATVSNKIAIGKHGNGGGYSAIKYDNIYLIIAGGGGAGGGGIATKNAIGGLFSGNDQENGGAGQENNEISSILEEIDAYSGKAATNANYHASTGSLNPASISEPSKGGAAGSNYRLSDVYSEFPYNSSIGTSGTADPSGAGLVKVTRIIKETSVDEQDRTNKETAAKAILEKISFDLSGTWSDYFGGSDITPVITSGDIEFSDNTTDHKVTANQTITFIASANPVNGFLGGNDVPLFSEDSMDCGDVVLQYTYERDTGEASANIPLTDDESLKYVNVALAEPVFTAKDVEKIYGETFSAPDGMYNENDISKYNNEFVQCELTAEPSSGADMNNGTAVASQKYTLTATLTPTKNADIKATVISPVSAVQYSQEAELTVNYKVETELTNITCDADEKLPMYEDLSTALKAESGYELPSAITVKCGNTVLSPINGYRYSKTTGELFIPKEKITDNITITAEAVIPTYELVFRYYTDANNSQLAEKRFAYPAGTVFDANSTWHSEFYDSFAAEDIAGMTFRWNWGETGETPITEMPAQNWFVTGKYILNQYDLTIHYQDTEGNTLANDYQQTLLYGDEYNAASPAVTNYIPQTAVVSGTITDNTVITVIYKKIVGKLVVVYVDEDGKTISPNYEANVDADNSYNAVSPTITGYTPDISAVSGTMPSEGGVYQIVTYHPNEYTLSFDANGGSLSTADSSDRTVYYGKEIGWCGKDTDGKYTFEALPVPIKQGSTFLGWKLNGEIVKEDSVFTLTADAALTAEWELDMVTLKVYYFFEDGTEAAAAVSYTETPSGTPLTNSVIFPLKDVAEGIRTSKVANYEHYKTQCDDTVTMGFIDKAVNVIFVANEYTLTIKYKDEKGNEITGVTDTRKVKYGTDYKFDDVRTPESVNSSYTNHYASPSVIEGTMNGDTTVYVSFIRRDTEIHVTVDWSSLVFDAQNITWDPEQHIYYADSYLNEDTEDEYGTITVTNGSTNNTPIRASLSYSPDFGFENIQAEYTDTDDNDISSVVVPADGSAEIHVAPRNRISIIEQGEYNVGTCTVSLSAGG